MEFLKKVAAEAIFDGDKSEKAEWNFLKALLIPDVLDQEYNTL